MSISSNWKSKDNANLQECFTMLHSDSVKY